jgi:hypothetical protein
MYVILAILALLLCTLFVLIYRLKTAARRAREREAVAARLAAVAVQAGLEAQARRHAAEASDALTAVLPAIQSTWRDPRHVA